jgi:hypothetical protein
MSVSGNFTVPDNLPKLFIFHNIWKILGASMVQCQKILQSHKFLITTCFFVIFVCCPAFSHINVRVFYSLPCYQNYFGRIFAQ